MLVRNMLDQKTQGLPLHGSDGKESACSAGDLGSIPGLGRAPGEGNGNSLRHSWPGELHGQRSLEGCSSWSRKETQLGE